MWNMFRTSGDLSTSYYWRITMNKGSIIFTIFVVLGFLAVVYVQLGEGTTPAQDPSIGYGPNPKLPAPDLSLVPVLRAPNAIGWAEGEKPNAANGMQVS